MSHVEALASTRSALADLRARSEALSDHLAAAAREMKASGALPGVSLIDELDNLRSQFADLRRNALEIAAAIPGAGPPEAHQLTTLPALDAMLGAAEQALARHAAERRAFAVLDRVQSMRHRDDSAFAPLEQCQLAARELRETLSNTESGGAERDALAEGRHPLAGLVQFAEDQAGLDDARWEFLHDVVSQAFGRQLAVAAARGKLWVPVDTTEPPAPPPETDPENEDDWPTSTLAWPESHPSAPTQVSRVAPSARREPPGRLDHDPSEANPADFLPEADAAAPPASAPDRLDALDPDALIWQALLRDRPAAAFLVATYAHQATGAPVQLLRALALSPHLQHVNGDIALQLTEDFAHWDPRDLGSAGEGEHTLHALWLLALVSTLRPALIAPDSGAWAIVKGLPDNPALPNLQRYSRVIAGYGERHPPLASHTFGPPLAPAAWRDTLEDLLREIGAWRVKFLGMRSTFPPVDQVWRQWLRPDGPIHALLAPLALHDHGLETARGLAERLSNTAQIEWEIAETDRRLLGRRHGPDITARPADAEQLVQRMREAVAFARRWIALQEHRPERPDGERGKQARAVREELIGLGRGVDAELAELALPGAALPLRAAVAQCRVALARLRTLLGAEPLSEASAWWIPVEEPPPRLLLQSDLLHVDIAMDGSWHLPRVDGAQVLRGLGPLIEAEGSPDWQATFALYLRRQDHLATQQVIECVQLRDRVLGARLQTQRAKDLERAHTSLRSQVELTRDRVDLAAAEGRLDEQQRARHMSFIEHVALTLPKLLRFEPRRERLLRIRQHVDALSLGDEHTDSARAAERDDLVSATGPSLVAARPGMGTSTLLGAAAESFRASGQQHVALLVDMSTGPGTDQLAHPVDDGRSVNHSAHGAEEDGRLVERFWDLVAAALNRAGLAPATGFGWPGLLAPDSLMGVIHAWLTEDPARALLLLVDHADVVLDDEANLATDHPVDALYPTSARLGHLLQSSGGRVKIALAGSLTVLRAARLCDYPLARAGCVCLPPLLDHDGWRAAVALLGRRLDGIPVESPVVFARALSLANYEPRTITRLGELLAERVAGSTLTRSILDDTVSSREGRQALSAGLVGMLRRDPRLAVIVYSLALAAWAEDADDGNAADGVTSGWLREQASTWWPDGFAHAWSNDAFDDLLDELLGLGLVRALAANSFILGQPNWLDVLGTPEELIGRLFDYASATSEDSELEYEYAAANSRPVALAGPAGRSPLTARQLSRVLDDTRLACVIFGTQAAGLLQVPPALQALAGSTQVVTLASSPEANDCPALLRRMEEVAALEPADSHLLLVVSQTWAWTREWLDRAVDFLETVGRDRPGACQAIFLADPATTWRVLGEPDDPLSTLGDRLRERGVDSVSLTPWRQSVILGWSAEQQPNGSAGIDADQLEAATGCWPLLVQDWQPGRARFQDLADEQACKWTDALGLGLPPARALQPLAVLEQASEASLTELAEVAHKSIVARSLEWARLLHLARPVGSGQWRLDPIASRVLRAAPSAHWQPT